LEKYGLKSPALSATVTVKTKDGKTEDHIYQFGNETEDKSSRYAKQGERDVIFTVRTSTLAPLQADLADPTVLSFDPAKVKGLKLTGWAKQSFEGKPTVIDLERKSSQDWSVKGGSNVQVHVAQAESFLMGLNHLQTLRFVVLKTGAKPEHKL